MEEVYNFLAMPVMTHLASELTPPNRIEILEGDIFTYKLRDAYRYLRVIRDIDQPGYGRVLLYFYKPTSPDPHKIPILNKTELLIPPFIGFREYLRDGFTLRVEHRDFQPGERYERHCFPNISALGKRPYVDEFRNEYDEPFEPLLNWKWPLTFATTEVDIANALGWMISYKEARELPPVPRPLLRKAMNGKLPHRYLELVLPGLSFPDLETPRPFDDPLLREISRNLEGKEFRGLGEFGGWTLKRESAEMILVVKKRQFAGVYSYIHDLLASLGVERYWIQDRILRDWLAGTYKDPNHQAL